HRRFVFDAAAEACAAHDAQCDRDLIQQAHLLTASDALVRTLVAQGKGIGLSLVGRLPADVLPADVVHLLPETTKATLALCLLTPRPERLDPVVAAVIENLHRMLDVHFQAEAPPA
ncbi:MAG: hypothetical protein KC583_23840, partial [Myxococcales bacterium]|nr:hypothetical protein [Myxococcales bacterium]